MKQKTTPIFTTRYWIILMSALLLAIVSACGGGNGSGGSPLGPGGGGGGGGGGSTLNGVITVKLSNSAGAAANTIPAGGSLVVTAHVVDATGAVVPNAVVAFTIGGSTGSGTVGSLPVASSLTNSSGDAVVTLQGGTTTGAATLTATTTVVGTTAITATANFQSGATGATASPNIALSLVSSSSCPANTVTASCPITATATVTDATGAPVAGTIVTFANSLTFTTLSPTAGAVITNSNGVATVTVAANGLPTSGQIGTAGTINASTTIGGVTVSAGKNYTLGNTAITLGLITPASGSANVNAYGTSTISVQVNSNGAIYTAQPVTVNFSSGCAAIGKATLATTTTTVNGVAQVTYTDKGCGSVDTVNATVAGAASPVTVTLNVTPPVATSINFTSAVPSDRSIVLPGTGGTGRTSTATLTYTVVDTSGNPIINGVVVNFTNNNPSVATLNEDHGTTAADGTISVTVTAATVGTFAITASLASDPTKNAISNSVIVSTGQPVQASFSLAASTFNIEGLNYDGTTTTLTAFIADANGNPVVNGTPVVATTNEGSVGNASGISAGCTTVNGQCPVVFTSQNPKCANGCTSDFGIATVNFSSTNSTTVPITGSIQIYMSGGNPHVYSFLTGTWVDVTGGANLVSNNCSPNIALVIADENGNPMPAGTTFAVTTTTSGFAPGSIFPSSNPSIGVGAGTVFPFATPNGVVNGQTVVVPFTLSSPLAACNAAGSLPALPQINFSITTTTPKGIGTIIPFTYKYPV